jgi:nucleotide-binding universal stress UspA family protein
LTLIKAGGVGYRQSAKERPFNRHHARRVSQTDRKGLAAMPDRIAYLPLDGQEPISDTAILNALAVGVAFGCKLHVANFTVDVPPVASPLGGFMINIEGMARAAEERSRAECQRRKALIEAAPMAGEVLGITTREIAMGGVMGAAASEARCYDLSLVPVPTDSPGPQDMAQALVFDSGLPVLLVPEAAKAAGLGHLAIAWDGSRVAARALQDALRLLAPGGNVTVLTVHGEKVLAKEDLAGNLAATLRLRGYDAKAVNIALDGRPIAEALQAGAKDAGAGLLAMGGFGHSRWRDFILGGATLGMLSHLRMPVLLSH